MLRGLSSLAADVRVIEGGITDPRDVSEADFFVMEGVRGANRLTLEAHQKAHQKAKEQGRRAPRALLVEYGYAKRASNPDDQENRFWQVSLDRLGRVPNGRCAPDRLAALGFAVPALRTCAPDAPIIICGDNPGLPQFTDFTWPEISHWAQSAIEKIRKITKRRIFWRPHPIAQVGVAGVNGISLGPIKWADQWACVVKNSNSGNEAFMAGCPVFSDGTASFLDIANKRLEDIEAPWFPDRGLAKSYLERLAYGQWLLPEIEKGDPFRYYFASGELSEGAKHKGAAR